MLSERMVLKSVRKKKICSAIKYVVNSRLSVLCKMKMHIFAELFEAVSCVITFFNLIRPVVKIQRKCYVFFSYPPLI